MPTLPDPRNGLAIVLAGLLSGCVPIYMSVKAHSDPEAVLRPRMTFRLVSIEQTTGGPLAEKELHSILRSRLRARGFEELAEGTPDLVVAVSGFTGPFEAYVPPSTFYLSVPSTTTSTTNASGQGSYSGWNGGNYVSGTATASGTATTTTRSTDYVPITTGGYNVVQHYRNISILVTRPSRDERDEHLELVWTGQVDSSGSSDDLIQLAPYFIEELLKEFPHRSGLPSERTVYFEAAR